MKRTFGRNLTLFVLLVLFTLCMAVGCTKFNASTIADDGNQLEETVEPNTESSISFELGQQFITGNAGDDVDLKITVKMKNDTDNEKDHKWGSADFFIKSAQAENLELATDAYGGEGYEVEGGFGNIDRYSTDLISTEGTADESKGFLRFQLSARKDSNALSAKEDLVINIKFKLINAIESSAGNQPTISFSMDNADYNKIATYTEGLVYSDTTLNTSGADISATVIGKNADTSLETLELLDKEDAKLNTWDTTTTLSDYESDKANKDNTYIHVKAKQKGALIKVYNDGAEVNADLNDKYTERKEKLALSKGEHVIRIEVTAPNGSSTATYSFKIKQTYAGLDSLGVVVDGTSVNATKSGLDTENTPVEPDRYSYNIYVPFGDGGAEQVVITPAIIAGYGIKNTIEVTGTNCTPSLSSLSSGSSFSVQTSSMGSLSDSSSLKLKLKNSADTPKEIEIKFIKCSTDAGYSSMTLIGTDDSAEIDVADNGIFYLPKSTGYSGKLNLELNQDDSTAKLTKLNETTEIDIAETALVAGTYTLTITAPAGNTKTYTVVIANEAVTGAIVNFEYNTTNGDVWNSIFDFDGNIPDSKKYDANKKKFSMEMPIGTESFKFRLAVTDASTTTATTQGELEYALVESDAINSYDAYLFTLTNLSTGINEAKIYVNSDLGAGNSTYTIEIILVEDKFGITDIDLGKDGDENLYITFDPDTLTYSFDVLFATSELDLTVSALGASTVVYMDGAPLKRDVDSTTTSSHTGNIKLRSGTVTTVKITFKGTDGYKNGDKEYTININRLAADSRNTLKNLELFLTNNEGTSENKILNFAADSDTQTKYTVELSAEDPYRTFTQIEIKATATSNVATIYGAGIKNIGSSDFEKTLELTVNVQPENSKQGFGMLTYTIMITVTPLEYNEDNTVYGVSIYGSDGANHLTGANEFNQSKNTYNITVPYSVNAFSVEVKTHPSSKSEIKGTPINNDNLNDKNMYNLVVGNNTFTVQAVSEKEQTNGDRNGTKYTFTITRASALTNANLSDLQVRDSLGNPYIEDFNANTFTYKVHLGNANNTNKIKIQATSALATANISLILNDTVLKESAKELTLTDVEIDYGQTKDFIIKVVVDDTERLYKLVIERESSAPALKDLSVLADGQPMDLLDKDGKTIEFDSDVLDYYVEIPFNSVNFRITGTPVENATPSTINNLYTVDTEFGVDKAGQKDYKIVIEKGLRRTYTVWVTRLAGKDSNVDIESITIDQIPAFATDFNNDTNLYGIYDVNNNISALDIDVVLANEYNTNGVKVLVNGVETNELKTGLNTVQIVVTSSDKIVERTITFQVNRKVPSIMSMTATDKDGGAVESKINFVDNKNFYNMTVGNKVSALNLNFNLSDGYSVSKITGNNELAEGKNNTVTVEIVNSKNEVVRTIELNVYREAAVSYTIWYIVAGVLGALVLLLLILAIVGFAKGGRRGGKRGTINDIGIGDYELD